MKKLIILFVFIAISFTINSQTLFVPNGTNGIGSTSPTIAPAIGIGTSTPSERLHIINEGPSFLQIESSTDATNAGIKLKTKFSASTATSQIFMDYMGSPNIGLNYISGRSGYSNHWFKDASNNVQMLIRNDGFVGMGTSNPQARLDVNGNIQISNSLIPMGLMTEVTGGYTPVLNLSLNFREAFKSNSYLGASFRIDSRNNGANLFQWYYRAANSGTEAEIPIMTLTRDGNLTNRGSITTKGYYISNGGNMNDWSNSLKFEAWDYSEWFIKNDPYYDNLYICPNQDISNGLILNPGALSVGNSVSNGKTSLKLYISGTTNGYTAIQSVKSYPSTYGILALNPSGGPVNIGTTSDYGVYGGALNIFKNQNPNLMLLSGSNGYLELGVASNDGAYANFARTGDAIIRKLGGTGSLIFNIPNDNGDGSSYIKFGDGNGEIFGIYSNKIAKLNGALMVDGKIECEEIEVKDVAADFVFSKDYKLSSLYEVEAFINQNGHLPEIPSASETEKGIKLGEFNEKLLQKIEELTLYLIELKKENDNLKQKMSGLESQIK